MRDQTQWAYPTKCLCLSLKYWDIDRGLWKLVSQQVMFPTEKRLQRKYTQIPRIIINNIFFSSGNLMVFIILFYVLLIMYIIVPNIIKCNINIQYDIFST